MIDFKNDSAMSRAIITHITLNMPVEIRKIITSGGSAVINERYEIEKGIILGFADLAITYKNYEAFEALVEAGAKFSLANVDLEALDERFGDLIDQHQHLIIDDIDANANASASASVDANADAAATTKRDRSPSPIQKSKISRTDLSDSASGSIVRETESASAAASGKTSPAPTETKKDGIVHRPKGAPGRRRPTRRAKKTTEAPVTPATQIADSAVTTTTGPAITPARAMALGNPGLAMAQLGAQAAAGRMTLRKHTP